MMAIMEDLVQGERVEEHREQILFKGRAAVYFVNACCLLWGCLAALVFWFATAMNLFCLCAATQGLVLVLRYYKEEEKGKSIITSSVNALKGLI